MQIKETFLNLTKTYQNAINRLEKLFDPEFEKAVKLINSSDGHIVVCGMGKSGLVGRKISSTLASTGTPSYFLHPSEAIHGDLGIVQLKSIKFHLFQEIFVFLLYGQNTPSQEDGQLID